MIVSLPTPARAAQWCKEQKQLGKSLGYVPTMGALHAGHLSLVQRAIEENDCVCASIFVNPLQFNNADDLAAYPRNLAADLALFEQAGCAMAYSGTLMDFFPEADSMEQIKMRPAGRYGIGLEGESRPQHLDGVATIVERLFRTVGDCKAYFGEKDYQQTLVINDLAQTLQAENLHVDVVVCPTVRNDQGLALSSRNHQLNAAQQQLASHIYRALISANSRWHAGERDRQALESAMQKVLAEHSLHVLYASVRDEADWNGDHQTMVRPRGFVAVDLDGVRLIDNLSLTALLDNMS